MKRRVYRGSKVKICYCVEERREELEKGFDYSTLRFENPREEYLYNIKHDVKTVNMKLRDKT